MHIPENYLSPSTCAVMAAAMVPVLAVSVKKVKEEVTRSKMPMLGVGAAFSFLIMMFNVPLPGGTTGHAVGGVLLAILLGPYSACISVTVALFLQALLFGDGGVLSLGANCFNMAFILPFAGWFIYRLISGRAKTKPGEYAGIVLGSYLGINIACLIAAVEFGIQPLLFRGADGLPLYCPYPLSVSIPAMLIPHLLVAGLVEAAFTASIYAFIKNISPGMLYEGEQKRTRPVYALLAALICLVPLGLLAAGTAWGEWSAEELSGVIGYTPSGLAGGGLGALIPDYAITGVPEAVGYILSAVFGAAILIILFKLISSFMREKRSV